MLENVSLSRRAILRRTARLGIAGTFAMFGVGTGCAERLSCDDVSHLSTPDTIRRNSMKYVAVSPQGPQESCATCKFFTAGPADQCGTCSLVPGPIHPEGRCTLWAAS
ncbi:MAG: high-potential iron-sulfur protein [Candidatus Binatia bacterium]|nr:high-potential iron-sulfur protein [Candidatus Binatia bacterium]